MGSLGEDVKNQVKQVDEALVRMDDFFGNLEDIDYDSVKNSMSPIERATYDITISFAINSLFWMYMRSFGEDPTNHKIKEELDRIKQQMRRRQLITDKAKRPQVDKEAVNRMVRHGINHHAGRKRKAVEDENWENEQQEAEAGSSSGASAGAAPEKVKK
ncbi:Nuclear nucleic acid-binding protein C1D [Orchesella cincta]|uniref:Nuclear nucleic acid-binding protein C1D n=1 Tax=Orchesella cincta TaxID=48709 RepID=A0A1D2MZ00_ORCCI|nr:Nuclear nucleic acid-binding protein C1D [Orchesella cincta]